MNQPPTTEIRTEQSTVVYRNRWMTVREDHVVRADGSSGIFGVVEKPDFAVIAAFEAGKLVLVEQYRYPVKARQWELPQGSWEGQDIDPLTLAKAELLEETGLVAGTMLHAGHLLLASGYSNQGYDVYFASGLTQSETALDPEEQGLVAHAFPLAEVEAMIRSGSIQDATSVAALGLLRIKGLL
ncbi:NUDIX domain-containing protein [Niveibacterium terrae]|uniref:NUDIX domain-containing protein n=1 Tax=Niveibacterium terrae TaxID=3373598 RepID=UPI003A8F740C